VIVTCALTLGAPKLLVASWAAWAWDGWDALFGLLDRLDFHVALVVARPDGLFLGTMSTNNCLLPLPGTYSRKEVGVVLEKRWVFFFQLLRFVSVCTDRMFLRMVLGFFWLFDFKFVHRPCTQSRPCARSGSHLIPSETTNFADSSSTLLRSSSSVIPGQFTLLRLITSTSCITVHQCHCNKQQSTCDTACSNNIIAFGSCSKGIICVHAQ